MRALIQRVKNASVTVENEVIGKIDKGILVFLGITHGDNQNDSKYLLDKISNLRIFENELGKLDLSLLDLKGEILLVSQFTLYGTCDKGRRPDFGRAAQIDEAKRVYDEAVEIFKTAGLKVETGKFQANMQVGLVNDGPVTLMIESKK